jgi:hypothetical protein
MTAEKLEEWLQGYLARCTLEQRRVVEAGLATASPPLREATSRRDVIEQCQLHDKNDDHFVKRVRMLAEAPATSVDRRAEFDPDQLERLMVTAFELLGKPQAGAQEFARAILKAAARPQSGEPRWPPDWGVKRPLV